MLMMVVLRSLFMHCFEHADSMLPALERGARADARAQATRDDRQKKQT